MKIKNFNKRITIMKYSYDIDMNGTWSKSFSVWKRVWADITQTINADKSPIYKFIVRWQKDFPKNFNVSLNDDVFNIASKPVATPDKSWVVFFGTKKNNMEDYT